MYSNSDHFSVFHLLAVTQHTTLDSRLANSHPNLNFPRRERENAGVRQAVKKGKANYYVVLVVYQSSTETARIDLVEV